jgi:hypothetical protein
VVAAEAKGVVGLKLLWVTNRKGRWGKQLICHSQGEQNYHQLPAVKIKLTSANQIDGQLGSLKRHFLPLVPVELQKSSG